MCAVVWWGMGVDTYEDWTLNELQEGTELLSTKRSVRWKH
jgi:hypothetical protein